MSVDQARSTPRAYGLLGVGPLLQYVLVIYLLFLIRVHTLETLCA